MKRIPAILLCFTAMLSLNAQDWSGKVYQIGKIYPGYYITLEGDTLKGYFYHGSQSENQMKCRYYVNETDKKPKLILKPEDIKGYKVADKVYRSIHFSGGLLAKPLRFNLVTKEGAITEFIFYDEYDPKAEPKTVFLKYNDEKNPDPVTLQDFGIKFAKKMSDYVADYPELSTKVINKEKGYGMLNILAIISEYNKWAETQKK